jgi:DNA-binding LacI/PurR family transcriptional regulator
MADVAKQANVSRATVSYVIRGERGGGLPSRISDETRKRVLDAMEQVGYSVNEAARSLRRQRTDRVLLLLERLSSPYANSLANQIRTKLDVRGYELTIVLCTNDAQIEKALHSVQRQLADGAIVDCSAGSPKNSVLEHYAGRGVPIVGINTPDQPVGFDALSSDEDGAIDQAISSFIASGHTRIAVLTHEDSALPESRMMAVEACLNRHSISLEESNIVPGAKDRVRAFHSVVELLKRPDRPTALYSFSDVGAISAIWAAQSLGLSVPGDIAIIGTGNIDEGEIVQPALSSVGPIAPDFTPAADLLIARMTSPTPRADRTLSIPWEFVERASSRR